VVKGEAAVEKVGRVGGSRGWGGKDSRSRGDRGVQWYNKFAILL